MYDFLINNPKNLWAIMTGIMFIGAMFSLIKAHFNKENEFDLIKLLAYDSDGKMSDSKARLNGAFVVMTWAFVFLTMQGKLTEWYALIYVAAWVTDRIAARSAKLKESLTVSADK